MGKSNFKKVARALNAKPDGDQFYTRAICHNDRDPSSLSVGKGEDDFPVITCHAGCEWPKVRDALIAAGVPSAALRGTGPRRKVESREHVFEEENGELWHRVKITKFSDGSKDVKQHRWERDGWRSGLGTTERILYGLPGLLRAVKADKTIHLTEGEKDANNLNEFFKEHDLPELATCSGAPGKWSKAEHRQGYLKSLRGAKQVVIWADRDSPGYADALERFAAVSAAGLPATLRLPIPTTPKADVSDHLDAGHKPKDGVTVTEHGLRDLVGEAAEDGDGEGEGDYEQKVAREVTALRVRAEAKAVFQAEQIANRQSKSVKARRLSGSEFFMDLPDAAPVLWGDGKQILWIDGEPSMIVGDDGTGKSTIDHQLIAARLGIIDDVLGYSVTPATRTVVYLAMDRPEQARRAGNRLFPEDIGVDFRSHLEQLAVWSGPLPFDVQASPENLADWLQAEFGDVGEVHVDSLKDIASNLSEDSVGSRINLAIQAVVSRGINWFGLHHQRKANGENKSPDALSDVYGSRWLTAGHGSVLMLSRAKGEKEYVELTQIKEPADRVPRLLLRHDRSQGMTHRVSSAVDLEGALLQADEAGATIRELAAVMYPNEVINSAVLKKIDRQIKKKIEVGEVRTFGGSKGGSGGSTAARYALVDEDET